MGFQVKERETWAKLGLQGDEDDIVNFIPGKGALGQRTRCLKQRAN
jgi:hypothetical protein